MRKVYLRIVIVLIIILSFSEISSGKTRIERDTLWAGVSEYVYNSIAFYYYSISRNPDFAEYSYIKNSSGLDASMYLYSPLMNYSGNDTTIIVCECDENDYCVDTIIFIFHIKPFTFPQNQPFSVAYAKKDCDYWNYNFYNYHRILTDSVYFYGRINENCCSENYVNVEYSGDTILVSFVSVNGGCMCDCSFSYSFSLPLKGNEKYIKYGNEMVGLSINEKNSDKQLHIYPNPVKDYFSISQNIYYDKVEIYTESGLLISTFDADELKSVESLSSGVYILSILENNKKLMSTFFVKK